MSCHLCYIELEFNEIAGFNPNLPPYSEDRTNFCWEDEEQTIAAPICDACYWAEGSSDEDDAEDDEEINEAMYSSQCVDCGQNPSTPPKSTSQRSVSPSFLQAEQPLPSSLPSSLP
jgi:hypothetical protein